MSEKSPDFLSDTPFQVAMIGPVPPHWGGQGRWLGGGISSYVHGLLPALSQYEINIQFLADNTNSINSRKFPNFGPKVTFYPMVRSIRHLSHLNLSRAAVLILKALGNSEYRNTAPFGQFVRFLGQAINYDYFLNTISADILHIHHAFNRQYICQNWLKVNLPLIVTAQSVNQLIRPHPLWIESMITTNYHRAHRIIAVSNYVKEKVIEYGANPDMVSVIPNGVDIKMFSPESAAIARANLSLSRDDFIVLFCGNLIPRKGVDILIKAFSQFFPGNSKSRLIIIGRGPEQDNLLRLTQEIGLNDHIIFAGYKTYLEMPMWYQACDAFVMPSWAEGLSLSILEAMACGKPIITTYPDIGTHDAVTEGINGLLTKYGDVGQLAQALVDLARSPKIRGDMGNNSRQLAKQEFSWGIIGQKTIAAYRGLLRNS